MTYSWTTPIEQVKGVGPPSAVALRKKRIKTVGDLLEFQPKSYYLPEVTPLRFVKEGQHVIVQGMVANIQRNYGGKGWTAIITDDDYDIKAAWFGYNFAPIHLGDEVTMWGKYRHGHLQQPEHSTSTVDVSSIAGGMYGKLTPIIRKALREVFSDRDSTDLGHIYAHGLLHFPRCHAEHTQAIKVLKHRELLLLHLAMETRRRAAGSVSVGPLPNPGRWNVWDYFPYDPTTEQASTLCDILEDLTSGKPMNRLIHGEVGSGKTAVAFYAAMRMALAGKRTLIVCPTTILAQQHYDTLKGMGWNDVHQLSHTDGSASIMIGTHVLLNRPRLLEEASLVVIDETQKFGVGIKAKLAPYNLHTLLMSATPIPRSLAMTVFGDLDLSVMKELPIKRGTVLTKWVAPDRIEGMYDMITSQLAQGKQAYIVYPRITSAKEDVVNAEAGFAEMNRRFASPTCTVGILTGRMTELEKSETLKQFMSGEISVLVSTIIAEVGLDCSNATVMVVQGADRFGLSQLHQLRGRVCRSTDTAFCFLVSKTDNATSIARLDVMEKCNDGFEIAEHDMRLRGPGDLFSLRQHGIPDLKFADLVSDYKLSCETKEEAKGLVDRLDEPENARLKSMLSLKYGDVLEIGGVG